MIIVKRLAECTLEDAVLAWNKGFEGYFFNMTTTVEQFTKRLVLEGLSPTLSVVAYDEDKPIGIILNGFRVIDGKKVSWNGGTGVAPDYRGNGVGRKLMEAVLSIYDEENVDISTLEAVKQNEKAIKLYEKLGYKIKDDLLHLQHTGPLSNEAFMQRESGLSFSKGIPIDASTLSIYKKIVPWQNQWNSARDGESILAEDQNGQKIGYCIYKRVFNEEGKLVAIVLLQCEVAQAVEHKEEVIQGLLARVFSPFDTDVIRTAGNFSVGNEITINLLKKAGFEVKAEQVFMIKSN